MNSCSIIAPGTRLLIGLLAVVTVVASILSAPDTVGILGAGLALLMLTIAIIDWRHFIIPNALTGAGLCLAIVHATVKEPEAMLDSFTFAVLRGITFALVPLAFDMRTSGCAAAKASGWVTSSSLASQECGSTGPLCQSR